MEIKRIPTGIHGFDELCDGGFVKGSINAVSGDIGTAKTLFALRFLVDGAEKCREKGIMVTFEEQKEQVCLSASSLGLDLANLEKSGMIAVLPASPEQIKHMITEGGGQFETLAGQMKAQRLAFDSASSFMQLFADIAQAKKAAGDFFRLIRKLGCTAVLTLESDDPNSRAIAKMADSLTCLYHFRDRGIRKRALEIIKMRGTEHNPNSLQFEITKTGISVDPKKFAIIE
ncbi:TPA: hypothetical protein HA361_00315 [Candidatus Woesearchaeota archaeon]|nr:hypothetical protein [Candidatus Woesearchaeota archaeon]HII69360.1 hypothetical protein [Candidatus Woesearchaeota archaeon]